MSVEDLEWVIIYTIISVVLNVLFYLGCVGLTKIKNKCKQKKNPEISHERRNIYLRQALLKVWSMFVRLG